MIAIISVVFAVFAAIIVFAVVSSKSRRKKLAGAARRIGFSYAETASQELLADLRDVLGLLLAKDPTNTLSRKSDDGNFYIFDFATVSKKKGLGYQGDILHDFQTAFAFRYAGSKKIFGKTEKAAAKVTDVLHAHFDPAFRCEVSDNAAILYCPELVLSVEDLVAAVPKLDGFFKELKIAFSKPL